MTIKNKLRAGFGFLFLLAFICCGVSIYYLNRLSAQASVILKNNYETLRYMRNIGSALDEEEATLNSRQRNMIESNLAEQEHNITEPGEQQLTDSLRSKYEQLKLLSGNRARQDELRREMRITIAGITQLNMSAIEHKNGVAKATARDATLQVALIGTLLFLIAFSFIVNYPGYIANPIRELTEKIQEISRRNYQQQLDFKSNDEFGELASAFNIMTFRLAEYENSNLASIMFEKRRIETIINSMHDGIIGLDEHSFVIFANDVACTLMGIKEANLVGKYAPDVALENDLLRNLLVTDQTRMKIYADNRESYYSKEILSVISREKTIGKVIILKNITEFQQLDEAKTNFIATISHELKTPISSIKMSLKLLEDERVGNMNDEQKQLLGNIDDDARRLLQI
ncbi:MAG TPA: histidine kinase dimerization/phospho-acceptor domain-containing protein, partial [Mucilaginibacter sp.]|nr:histidine kinase dimerization/phospho-acceptor domain-containing protein [Mucilaginibacter sp.]